MKKPIILTFLSLTLLNSCNKEIKSQKGAIDVISNIYVDASKNLDNTQSFLISRLNYSNDTIIELVPDPNNSVITKEINFIKDTVFYSLGEPAQTKTISEVVTAQKPRSVYSMKDIGAVFTKDKIPNYEHRRTLKDTILFKKKYKRFEINSPKNFTRYYVYETDTIFPYSLYRHAEIDYKGRIERIDTYNKEQDIFVTLQLLPRKNWDEEAKDILKFNDFINKKSKK